MSYQALARKWRPRRFEDVVGQDHVVRALTHSLDSDRVHHAFLFTGTRGVGKTTIARILARSLNCIEGVSATPCGKCDACVAIDEGRFVDLIEVDAASRTKVEDTRDLLDNVQYAPTSGRYKVYLIDEVHMLSGHSFNALLKTLEEPPPHVKFLLATTDPQKLPVTVLSRCLQFNLRALDAEEITASLGTILEAEKVEFEPAALALLARAARGSLRDGLSLLDQAISHGAGTVGEQSVRDMLGTIDAGDARALLEGIADGDAAALLGVVEKLAAHVPDYVQVLDEIMTHLFHVSLAQTMPDALAARNADVEWLKAMAERMPAEDVQLYYQIALRGKQDLPLAPDPRAGIEMVLLRMLAFRPDEPVPEAAAGGGRPVPARRVTPAAQAPAAAPAVEPEPEALAEPAGDGSAPRDGGPDAGQPAGGIGPLDERVLEDPAAWLAVVAGLGLGGLERELAMHSAPESLQDGRLALVLDEVLSHLDREDRRDALAQAIAAAGGGSFRVSVRTGSPPMDTPARLVARDEQARQQAAEQAIGSDPQVRDMMERFGAKVVQDSIRPRKT